MGFEELGARVLGISLDSVKDQATFHEKQKLNFSLLSDPDGSAARKYGVLPEKSNYPRRVTFLIDPKGTLRHASEKVDVVNHGDDVVGLLLELQEN